MDLTGCQVDSDVWIIYFASSLRYPSPPLACTSPLTRTVKIEREDSRTADRCSPDDSISLLSPRKVLPPDLQTRIEQAHDRSRFGIQCSNPISLMIVAQGAGEPEVVRLCLPSEGFGHEVIDLHGAPTRISCVKQ
jgi:hypothetical protein